MSPPAILSEAKSIHSLLKDLLKTKEPFDKEVDFQRKTLRRRYLNLLLVHPYAEESKDVETHLWMQTSYAFISSYKQRISALDRVIQQNQRQSPNQQQQQQQQQQGQQTPQGRANNHGVVEHRKLVQRFRQFLADEEKFWTQLVLRLRRLFDLTEAHPALLALGLLTDVDEISTVEASETRDGVMHGANGRNHFQFPPEDTTVSCAPTTPEERQQRLAILSKALVCLGDIARYRELYNESNGRKPRNKLPPRPRNYDKARQCYEQARLLVPYDGNPSHQLAILSSYQKDAFGSLVHYYRSICVAQPYDTAADNLNTVLHKALDAFRQKAKKEKHDKDLENGGNEAQLVPKIRIDIFKERVVVLHALWRVGMDKGVEKMKAISPKHNTKVFTDFYALVSERHLPIDMITNTIVLAQGALFKHRMFRESASASTHRRSESTAAQTSPGTAKLIEWGLLDHLLDMHGALLEVGKEELKDPPVVEGVDDIFQRISAVFRRTLPALRIGSKWLRANFKYLMQDQEFAALQVKESAKAELRKQNEKKISGFSIKTIQFWKTYAQFILALSQAFPANKLVPLNGPLEEDIDMKGFVPLKHLMGEDGCYGKGKTATSPKESGEHPNVEQLMRICDLIEDAKKLANLENSPLSLINNHVVFNPDMVEDVRAPSHPEVARHVSAQEISTTTMATVATTTEQLLPIIRDNFPKRSLEADEQTEGTTQTEDGPNIDFIKQMVDDEDDEDQIVWNPRAGASPASPKVLATPGTPNTSLFTSKSLSLSPRSPPHAQHSRQPSFTSQSPRTSVPGTTTAQDLLNEVLNPNKFTAPNRGLPPPVAPQPSTPQFKPLFAPELSHRPNQSIWSASPHEQSQMYSTNTNQNMPSVQIYQTSPRQYAALQPPPQDLSQQSIWSSSYLTQSQNSQHNLVGALPSAPFAPQPYLKPAGPIDQRAPPVYQQQQQQQQPLLPQHHRTLSSGNPQFMPLHQAHHQQQDPFSYASSMNQPPIHRPEHLMSPSSLSGPAQLSQGGFGGGGPGDMYNLGGHYRSPPVVGQQSYMSPPPMSQVWGNSG
ncbi:hypothetical protein CPC08DRAFT_770626 [Agrocybe pediades]|nr:hypothetical protein CPC08DRAFT_770626 [Agrocybe pediades]